MEFIYEHVWGIAATILSAGIAVVASRYKEKYEEVKLFLSSLLGALEDGKLTPEEIQVLVDIGKKIIGASNSNEME